MLGASAFLIVVGCVIGAFAGLGGAEIFKPRVTTIDALAGLALGAFFVDRLVTFAPLLPVSADPDARAADLNILRWGYGAVLGGIFVSVTNLPAIDALTDGKAGDVSADVDRAIAVLAIAGGVVGLSRVLSAVNPKPKTEGKTEPKKEENEINGETPDAGSTKGTTTPAGNPAPAATTAGSAEETIDPPSVGARLFGYGAVGVAVLAALVLMGDNEGTELLAEDKQADGTVALVVRFATVLVAAAIIEQLIEHTIGVYYQAKNDKPIVTGGVALVLGVLMARVMDLYLLHNVGFFGTTDNLNQALAGSTDGEVWFDTFVTGAVIAAGTKPLHDLGSRLAKVKKPSAAPAAA